MALKKNFGHIPGLLQKAVQCELSGFSRGFALRGFGSDSWQIFTSFIGNSENIHIQGVEKACFQILKGRGIILKSPLLFMYKKPCTIVFLERSLVPLT